VLAKQARFMMLLVLALLVAGCGLADRTNLEVTSPTTALHVGETVQLSIIRRLPGGLSQELASAASGTAYFTTSESMLIPESDGKVTCIGTNGAVSESAIIGVANGQYHGHKRFELLQSGPGPGLEVIADHKLLREAESVQLHVFKSWPDGRRSDLTPMSTGTRYVVFAGNAFPDASVISVSDTGLASVVTSIGRYNYRTVIIFVRNKDTVGWIELKVVGGSRAFNRRPDLRLSAVMDGGSQALFFAQ
jgi:hypothetical protein